MSWQRKGYLLLVFLSVMIIFVAGCSKKSISPGEPYAVDTREDTQLGAEKERQKTAAERDEDSAKVEEYSAEEFGIESEEIQDEGEAEKEEKMDEAQKEKIKQDLSKRIYFDFDSYELKPEARAKLKRKAEIMKDNPELNMVIEGHCDERGTEEYNLALGERRARSAYEFLILLGVDSERLEIISYGEERPLNPAHNETAWAENRRAEFNVYYQ